MDAAAIIRRLEANVAVFSAQVADVGPEQARWKPTPEVWSIVEVVAHLADEETRDFRTRLDLTLHRPGEPWPPIDPPRWAVEERYLERDLHVEVGRFRTERARSVEWLRGLLAQGPTDPDRAPDWSLEYEHPRTGTMTAGDLLSAWFAHDLIHVRQINRLHRQYLEHILAPEASPDYAGPW